MTDTPTDTTETGGRRRRGGRRERPTGPVGPQQVPWRLYKRPMEPTRVVSDDELESIHLASLEVLRDTGMDFLHATALGMWAEAGAKIDGERVRFDPELITELISSVPSEFTMHAPDPAHDFVIGGDNVALTAVASAPNYTDRQGGRRTGNREDYRTLLKLTQSLNILHSHAGYPVEPVDLHPSIRHLEATRDILTLTNKAVNVYSLGAQRNLDLSRDGADRARSHRGRDRHAPDRALGDQCQLTAPPRHPDVGRHHPVLVS